MNSILAVTVPFFALVLAGYLAAWRGVLPAGAIPGLNAFVLYFALPCMLFRFGAGMPVLELLNPTVLLVYALAQVLIVFFTVAVSLNERIGLKDAAFGAMAAAFPNTGFMGVPLLAALLGPLATGPIISCILADQFFTSSLCLALAQFAHGGGAEDRRAALLAALRALRGALANPLPWAIALGALFSGLGLALGGPLDTVVRMLDDAASPVALFTIGAVLWRSRQHAQRRTPAADYVPAALIKLFLHPLLVLALALAARALAAPINAFTIMVLTLGAALPSASSVSMLAEQYGADNGRVARIIMTSTVLAFATFTALAWAFGVRPLE